MMPKQNRGESIPSVNADARMTAVLCGVVRARAGYWERLDGAVITIDFTAAARCIHELRRLGAGAGGAAYELECEIDKSSTLPPESKAILRAMLNRLFPSFGAIDMATLDELEHHLRQFDDFTRAYTVRQLQNTPLTHDAVVGEGQNDPT